MSKCSAWVAPSPSTKPAITNTAVSDTKLRRGQPGKQCPEDEEHSQDEGRLLEALRHDAGEERQVQMHEAHTDYIVRGRDERRAVQVTVLGKSPSWQDAAGACSGYLVQEGDFTLLLDCGNGVFSKLRRHCDYVDVDAVLITHLHADHFLDLIPFSYALSYAPRQQPVPVGGHPGTTDPARPQLYVPAGRERSAAHDRRLLGRFGPRRQRLLDPRVRHGRRADGRAAARSASARSRTSPSPMPSTWPPTARASPSAPTADPTTSWWSSPTGPTC